jgi:hypothetical protein
MPLRRINSHSHTGQVSFSTVYGLDIEGSARSDVADWAVPKFSEVPKDEGVHRTVNPTEFYEPPRMESMQEF